MAQLKYWDGLAWVDAVVGAQGPTGPTGATGPSALTTKGDIATFSTTVARLPIGANGQTLIPDSSVTLGVRWGDDIAVLQIMQAI